MLAHASTSVIDKVARNLQVFTPLSIATRTKLKKELEGVRRAGFAVSQGEWNEGVNGIAAPIFDANRQVVAAISIGAPGERMNDKVIRELAPVVIAAAQAVSRELGFRAQEAAGPG